MSSQENTDQIKSETFGFTGRRGSFFKLLLINLFLTIITLGIYRFWAKTNVRRFIWSNIRFMGDPLEYTGKGSELLLGFLIVLAVLFPLGLIYEAIQSLAPPEETALHIGLEILYYITIFALIQIGFYRAWRYRMSRTAWRGIRLGLDGSTWTFLKLSLGWSVLTVLTLGMAYPWMAVELWRYQITHTRIGETVAEFKGSGRELLLPWLTVNIPLVLGGIGFYVSGHILTQGFELSFAEIRAAEEPSNFFYVSFIGSLILMLSLPFGFLWFRVQLTQLQIGKTMLSNSRFSSALPFGRLLAFAFLAFILAISVVAVIFGVFTLPALTAFFFTDFQTSEVAAVARISETISFLGIGFAVIVAIVLFPMCWTIIYVFEFIKQLFASTTVTNSKALEEVIQSASDSQKTGEGLADALDIGGL